jgi:hypothetical protein
LSRRASDLVAAVARTLHADLNGLPRADHRPGSAPGATHRPPPPAPRANAGAQPRLAEPENRAHTPQKPRRREGVALHRRLLAATGQPTVVPNRIVRIEGASPV